jgi:hypothetical protein
MAAARLSQRSALCRSARSPDDRQPSNAGAPALINLIYLPMAFLLWMPLRCCRRSSTDRAAVAAYPGAETLATIGRDGSALLPHVAALIGSPRPFRHSGAAGARMTTHRLERHGADMRHHLRLLPFVRPDRIVLIESLAPRAPGPVAPAADFGQAGHAA